MKSLIHLTPHHVGCLTDNIERSIASYGQIGFQKISEIISISAQGVRVCFVELRRDFFLELVEFPETDEALKKVFKSGNTYYHMGYLVKDAEAAAVTLVKQDYQIINRFYSEAFQGRLCIFLYSPEMHLIELIEE